MAVDKVKPLKLETSIDGTENDMFPTETNPIEDYIAAKGISFENSDAHLVDRDNVTDELQYKDSVQTTYRKFNDLIAGVDVEEEGVSKVTQAKTLDFNTSFSSYFRVTDSGGGKATITLKRERSLFLVRNGSTSNAWLNLSDQGITGNRTIWIPPFDCDVIQVRYTNRNKGTSGNPSENLIKAQYVIAGNDDRVVTGDPTDWFIDNTPSANLLYNYNFGQSWAYNSEADGDTMLASRAYAFRIQNQNGNNHNDAFVEIIYREQ